MTDEDENRAIRHRFDRELSEPEAYRNARELFQNWESERAKSKSARPDLEKYVFLALEIGKRPDHPIPLWIRDACAELYAVEARARKSTILSARRARETMEANYDELLDELAYEFVKETPLRFASLMGNDDNGFGALPGTPNYAGKLTLNKAAKLATKTISQDGKGADEDDSVKQYLANLWRQLTDDQRRDRLRRGMKLWTRRHSAIGDMVARQVSLRRDRVEE